MLSSSLLRTFVLLVWILGHDVLKVTPQRLDGRKFVADRCNFFKRAVEFVDVLQDDFQALRPWLARCARLLQRHSGHNVGVQATRVNALEQFPSPASHAAVRSMSWAAPPPGHW